MSSVHFYTLNSERYESPDDVLNVVCRLSEKAISHQHNVYIHTASSRQSGRLDDLLWQFRRTSFVPHALRSSDSQNEQVMDEQVMLGESAPPPSFTGMLINLSASPAPSISQFSRVNEIVGPDEASLNAGRDRYRHYKAQGLEIITNKI